MFTHKRALQRIKRMDLFTKNFMELGFEKIMLTQNMGNCLRRAHMEACDALEISPLPELFIEINPFPNAYTYDARRFSPSRYKPSINLCRDESS